MLVFCKLRSKYLEAIYAFTLSFSSSDSFFLRLPLLSTYPRALIACSLRVAVSYASPDLASLSIFFSVTAFLPTDALNLSNKLSSKLPPLNISPSSLPNLASICAAIKSFITPRSFVRWSV